MTFVVLDWEPSYYDAHINVNIGKRVPAYSTAAGKAILAHLTRPELDALLEKHPLRKYTENTIDNKDELRRCLRESAERGYAVSDEEFNYDIVVVSSPIFDLQRKVIASCSTAALKSRIKSAEHIRELGEATAEVAQTISKSLGAK
jgi:IclR family pca regulon transcriptional regulator